VQGARQARQARNALDAFGHATLVVRAADGKIVWKTPLARDLLMQHFGGGELDAAVLAWVRDELVRRAVVGATPGEPLTLARQNRRLILALHEQTGDDEWLIVMRESSDQVVIDALGAAMGQRITFEAGAVAQRNFGDFPLARMSDAPEVAVAFLSTDFMTTGLGEPAYPSLAPALAGAIFQATGKRLRQLPFDTSLLTA
jgi:hypothetical protein